MHHFIFETWREKHPLPVFFNRIFTILFLPVWSCLYAPRMVYFYACMVCRLVVYLVRLSALVGQFLSAWKTWSKLWWKCWKTWYNCAVDALVQNSTKVPRTSVSFNWTLNWWNVQRTNRENKGLISADRNNKATLLLTIPRSIIVVCYGFILSNILYCYSVATQISLPSLRNPPCYDARIKDSICNHLTWRG